MGGLKQRALFVLVVAKFFIFCFGCFLRNATRLRPQFSRKNDLFTEFPN